MLKATRVRTTKDYDIAAMRGIAACRPAALHLLMFMASKCQQSTTHPSKAGSMPHSSALSHIHDHICLCFVRATVLQLLSYLIAAKDVNHNKHVCNCNNPFGVRN